MTSVATLIATGSGRPCAASHFTCASASRPYAGSHAARSTGPVASISFVMRDCRAARSGRTSSLAVTRRTDDASRRTRAAIAIDVAVGNELDAGSTRTHRAVRLDVDTARRSTRRAGIERREIAARPRGSRAADDQRQRRHRRRAARRRQRDPLRDRAGDAQAREAARPGAADDAVDVATADAGVAPAPSATAGISRSCSAPRIATLRSASTRVAVEHRDVADVGRRVERERDHVVPARVEQPAIRIVRADAGGLIGT